MAANRSTERRWILLATNGQYVTLGRASDPSADEITRCQDQLRRQGAAGWVAIMQGNPYLGRLPSLMEVRPLADPAGAFADAAALCLANIKAQREAMK